MRQFKTGRRAPVHNRRTMCAAIALHAALDPLGPPPSVSSDYVSAVDKAVGAAGWGILGNDAHGDCTIADCGHQVMLHTANAGSIVVPTTQECLDLYFKLTGGADSGLDEVTVCDAMQTAGLAGQKSSGSAPIDPSRLDHVRWAVQIFGACRLGIIVDSQMEDQFGVGQAWTTAAAANDPNAGGHDVPVVRYDTEYAYVVTWGRLQPVAWSLMAQSAFLEEAHAECWPDWVKAGGTAPNGFDLADLIAQLPRLREAA